MENGKEEKFCTYCGKNLYTEITGINWAEVMAIEDQVPDPDDLPVTLDLDTEIFCPKCEHEYLIKAKVRVAGDTGEIVFRTIEDQLGDEDRHPAFCKTCGADLVALIADPEKWICPVCNGVDTTDIAITEDCPMCGFPCHQQHAIVARCVHCKSLNLTFGGDYYKNPDEYQFFCDDCYDELMPEEGEE